MDRGGGYLYEFTYVKDVVRGLLALLDASELRHAVYNVGTGRQHRLTEVADVVSSLVPGASIRVGPCLPENVAPRAALSVERIGNELGYLTEWSLEDGIAELITWKRMGSQ